MHCEYAQYTSIFRSKDNFKHVAIGVMTMLFFQWSGIDTIIYYASQIFKLLGLKRGIPALLAIDATGIFNVGRFSVFMKGFVLDT